MPEQHGFLFPRTATGESSILPPPPWHYSGDLLTIEYRTDPDRLVELLPEQMEPADDPAAVAIVWADWQSCGDDFSELVTMKSVDVDAGPIYTGDADLTLYEVPGGGVRAAGAPGDDRGVLPAARGDLPGRHHARAPGLSRDRVSNDPARRTTSGTLDERTTERPASWVTFWLSR